MPSKAPLDHQLEALLFISPEPISVQRLAKLTASSQAAVDTALATLRARLSGGIRLAHANNTYQLVTAPEIASLVEAYETDSSRQDLSRAATETLAIVAYRGPITKSEIESIRGVASDTMLRGLLSRGLITDAGRSDTPGRPLRYAVSHLFLQHFGLTSTADLPALPSNPEEPHEN